MIQTYGLTHLALRVKNPERSSLFYQRVFGAKEMYHHADFIQVQTSGSHDIIVFEKSDLPAFTSGSIIHFGFRLVHATDASKIIAEVEQAGGTIKEQGEFTEGEPYVFFLDPDGYEVEVWYEKLSPENASFK